MPASITGARIKQRRKELGLSAEFLAASIGVSRATMYRYENGGIEKVPVDHIAPLAKALSLDPSYLMGWDDALSDLESVGMSIPHIAAEMGLPEDTVLQLINEKGEGLAHITRVASLIAADVRRSLPSSAQKESPAPGGAELTPTQQEAWEFIQQMDDEALERFIAAAKALMG